MNRFRRRLTYANVVASLSLFIALGGGAYAAVAITSEDIVDETIQSQDIAPEAVRTADIGKQAVTLDRMHDYSVNSAKVVNGSLSGADIANGSLTGWDLNVDVKTVEASTRAADDHERHAKTVSVSCPDGYTAVEGGGTASSDDVWPTGYELNRYLQLIESRPDGERGWTVKATLDLNDDKLDEWMPRWTLTAYARCAAL
jgi:hypothetical protein